MPVLAVLAIIIDHPRIKLRYGYVENLVGSCDYCHSRFKYDFTFGSPGRYTGRTLSLELPNLYQTGRNHVGESLLGYCALLAPYFRTCIQHKTP